MLRVVFNIPVVPAVYFYFSLNFFLFNQVSIVLNISQISGIIINITLDGQNYRECYFCMQILLRGFGLVLHLSEDTPKPKTDDTNADTITT